MNEIKIINFKKEHPETSFPAYRELPLHECMAITDSISKKHNIRASTPLEFLEMLNKRQKDVESENADCASFNLRSVLTKLHIQPLDMVFINRWRFDQIDSMSFDDVSKYFDDIWYPSADDIDIFDSSFEWILSIDHAGYLKLLK
jgi:hypothetical protein